MSDALDYVRNNCGMAGEDVAQMVDDLESQIAALRNDYQEECDENAVLEEKLAAVEKERDELVSALSSIRECLAAALFEGLQDRLAEEENTDVGSLYDLVTRRLLHIDFYAEAALAKLGADKKGEK